MTADTTPDDADLQVQRLHELVQKLELQNSRIRDETAAFKAWNQVKVATTNVQNAMTEKPELKVVFDDIDESDDQWLIKSPYLESGRVNADSTKQWLTSADACCHPDKKNLLSELNRISISRIRSADPRTENHPIKDNNHSAKICMAGTQSTIATSNHVTTPISSSFSRVTQHHNRFGYRPK